MNECTGDWVTTARLDKTPGVSHLTGTVHINNHNGTSITGEFRPQSGTAVQLLGGRCHPLPGQRRALSFHIEISGETFAFRGVVDPANPNAISCGAFVIVIGPPDPGDTGTWEATKGGNVNVGGSKGGSKGGRK